MKPRLKVKHVIVKSTSDELVDAGDCYVVENLVTTDAKAKPFKAVIMKCPFCGMDMASSTGNVIENHPIKAESFFERFLYRLLGYTHGVSVSPVLQCPYNRTHRFRIKNSKIIPLWQK